jgi:hypothetical protein
MERAVKFLKHPLLLLMVGLVIGGVALSTTVPVFPYFPPPGMFYNYPLSSAPQLVISNTGSTPALEVNKSSLGTDLKNTTFSVDNSNGDFYIKPASDANATTGLDFFRLSRGPSNTYQGFKYSDSSPGGGLTESFEYTTNDLTITGAAGAAPLYIVIDPSNTAGISGVEAEVASVAGFFTCVGSANTLGPMLTNGPTTGCALSTGNQIFGVPYNAPLSLGANGIDALDINTNSGMTTPSVTGGNKGSHTLNAGGLFVNGTAVSTAVGANPTASLGLTAVNGSAATFMRSDGAPALDQSISPTWSGSHVFSNSVALNGGVTDTGTLGFQPNSDSNGKFIVFAGGSAISGSVGGAIRLGTQASPLVNSGTNAAQFAYTSWVDGSAGSAATQGFIAVNTTTNTAGVNYGLELGNDTVGREFYAGTTSTTFSGAFATGAPTGEIKFLGSPAAVPVCVVENSIAETCFAHNSLKARGVTAAALVDITPDASSFTETYATGFTTTPTATAIWSRNGNQTCLFLPTLSATSNATGFTITGLPAVIQPTRTQRISLGGVQDNGTLSGSGGIQVTASGTLTLILNGNSAGFTATGTKGLTATTFCYIMN